MTLVGLVGASGAASANPGRGRGDGQGRGRRGPPDWAQFQNGRFNMAVSEREWESAPDASEVDHVPDHFKRLSYNEMNQGIQGLNKASEDGDVTFSEDGDQVEAEWHIKSNDQVGTLSHNSGNSGKTKLEILHQGPLRDRYRIFMDDNLTKDLVEAVTAASGVGAVAAEAALVSAGVTGPIGPLIIAAFAAVIAVELSWVKISNDGHGVAIDVLIVNDYVDPAPDNLPPYHYIQGQEHL
ncbi:hypothetical protein E6P09_01115 [Haloferax mediterranei ATCC 33500]|uniref:Uncharacterized protein n=2 Tax=Haloferax mediterranei (strain ATCC 33500 / DSM 1411 / JCM 8866 / NBRC 14739 / NCIMB 2177 / R-4) TaxID=523841 RepID=M0IVD3_HALMT|nr:hypothetical protein BM92_11325 [Haloferax mediterranei ATCC 33500]ELZ99768.1 hypothetical protein C439_12369 [Haloferax mediterranei ATCC 33500]QCQ73949.1 hypothetical protein E6P09_01115 [Haloferax mediterranei ATCC 33500]